MLFQNYSFKSLLSLNINGNRLKIYSSKQFSIINNILRNKILSDYVYIKQGTIMYLPCYQLLPMFSS